MALDSKAIETLSVNAVKNSIVTSNFLDQFIAENDKEPSWDGAIYIYGDKSKKKSSLKGRMPVQIKGKECNDHSKKEISYSMSTTDLRNYLYDGGCVLFVVYIGNLGISHKIYYAELTPVKLRQLLEEAKKQKSKTVNLKEFPTEDNRKATIFLNCLQNCQKQASFKEGRLYSLEELRQQGVLENIVITFAGVGCNDPQRAIINNEVYLYAKIKGSNIEQPLELLPDNIQTQEVIDCQVTIDDRLFYQNYRVIKSKQETTFLFGESFRISFDEDSHACKVKYKNSDKIRVLVNDLDFMLTYYDKGYFKIGETKIPFDYQGIDSSNFDMDEERKHLIYAKDIVRTLDILGCEDDLDVKELKDEDWRNLNRLITAFIDKKRVTKLKSDLPIVICISVGELKFAVYMKKCEEAGTYEIYDFFKTEFPVAFEDKSNENMMLPISQFSILQTDDFLKLSNIDFDILLPSFQKAEHHKLTFDRANWFLIELLNAYDKANGKRKEKILKACKEFAEWISEANEDELDYQIKILNVLQTRKRDREFNLDEIKTLYSLVEGKDTREDCRVAAYLLLGQQQAAEIHFAMLSETEQENFKEFPIYHFWKTEEK